MDDENILDNAVLRLDQAPTGLGLRVHEHADCLTADVLRVLNQHGWIEWRLWVRGAHGPELQLRDGGWTNGPADWGSLQGEYTGDISPEIRLSRYKGKARAAELRVALGARPAGMRRPARRRTTARKPAKKQIPTDLLSTAVVLGKFQVSRSTLLRAVQEHGLTSYRPSNAAANSAHRFSEAEIAKRYLRR